MPDVQRNVQLYIVYTLHQRQQQNSAFPFLELFVTTAASLMLMQYRQMERRYTTECQIHQIVFDCRKQHAKRQPFSENRQ